MSADDSNQLKQERDLYWRLLELGVHRDLRHLLEEALPLIVEVTRAKKGFLAIYGESQQPQYAIAHSCTKHEIEETHKKISRGIIAQAMASGKTINTSSAKEDPRFQENQSVLAHNIEEVLCAPIIYETPLGVLYLQDRDGGPFTEQDRQRAEAFARHLAPSVERLYTKQRRPLHRDPTIPFREKLHLEGLVGRSRALAELFKQVEGTARFDVSVLLTGPSGTGKTALARAIHDNSARAGKAFIELNCAALPENLFESELFGALQGSHSTATKRLFGKLSAAQGGTLFLDEIGELSLNVQSKLLQFLQSKEYFPLGAAKPEKADVRIITATNVNLKEAISKKTFREDLFYRFNVMSITVPPLSERPEDISLLCEHFCQETYQRYQIPSIYLSLEALRAAEESEWPGNIRELSNAIESATLRASVDKSKIVEPKHLFQKHDAIEQPTFQEATKRYQRRFLLETLEASDWNISESARRLGVTRAHVHGLVQALELAALHPKKTSK
jgi:transcriptional regulator with GAF, ATPase, and Fis domain